MRYEESIVIDLPIDEVVNLFDSEEHAYKWLKGLKSVEQISGTPGQKGAKCRMLFEMDGKEFDLEETILERNLPDTYSMTYKMKGVFNTVINRFEKVSDSQTRWVSDSEFKFDSIFMKLMSVFMRGMFKKQSCSNLQAFKDFAENGTNVNQA